MLDCVSGNPDKPGSRAPQHIGLIYGLCATSNTPGNCLVLFTSALVLGSLLKYVVRTSGILHLGQLAKSDGKLRLQYHLISQLSHFPCFILITLPI